MKDLRHLTTLCYVESEGKYLLMHRNRKEHDVNHDKWIGIGGHFKENESPDECLLREVKEESGLSLTSYRLRGIVSFISDLYDNEYMFLYTASSFEGTLRTECDEGELTWYDKDKIFNLSLWQGDRIFLRLLESEGECFSLKLVYAGETLTEAVLNGSKLNPDDYA